MTVAVKWANEYVATLGTLYGRPFLVLSVNTR